MGSCVPDARGAGRVGIVDSDSRRLFRRRGISVRPGVTCFQDDETALHNLAGAVEYVGGGLALMTLARDVGAPFKLFGVVVLETAVHIPSYLRHRCAV
jgi:hypothetical protein